MSEETKKSITVFKSPPAPILGTAFLIMLIAKCFNFMPTLSWWIVTCPLWGPFAICAALFAVFYGIAAVALIVITVLAIAASTFEAIIELAENLFRKTKEKED